METKHSERFGIHELLRGIIPEEQIERVFAQEMVDIDGEFLGFTEVYKAISSIVPKHYTIIDLGCAYAAQSFYFEEHKAYIGVDVFRGERFKSSNSTHYIASIQKFCASVIQEYDLATTMAICIYVPDAEARDAVRKSFENQYVYYPAGGEVLLKKLKKVRDLYE